MVEDYDIQFGELDSDDLLLKLIQFLDLDWWYRVFFIEVLSWLIYGFSLKLSFSLPVMTSSSWNRIKIVWFLPSFTGFLPSFYLLARCSVLVLSSPTIAENRIRSQSNFTEFSSYVERFDLVFLKFDSSFMECNQTYWSRRSVGIGSNPTGVWHQGLPSFTEFFFTSRVGLFKGFLTSSL